MNVCRMYHDNSLAAVPDEETLSLSGVLSQPREMEKESPSPCWQLPALLCWVSHSTGTAVSMAAEIPTETVLTLEGTGTKPCPHPAEAQ